MKQIFSLPVYVKEDRYYSDFSIELKVLLFYFDFKVDISIISLTSSFVSLLKLILCLHQSLSINHLIQLKAISGISNAISRGLSTN